MQLPKNRESGQALIMALILLAVGGLLVVPGLNLASTSLSYHQLIEGKTLESYSADSGVQYALTKLYNNPGGYTEYTEEDYLMASFDLNDRTANVTVKYMGGGIYKITSTATSDNGRSTTIVAYINLSAGAFAYVVAAKDYMRLENVEVDADEGGANIHSNGNIELVGGNVLVKGNASAVGTITGDVITGTRTPGSSWIQFPGDYSELYKTMAQEEDDIRNWDVTVTGGSLEDPLLFGPTYIEGDLTIGPNSFVRLTGTVYVTGTIAVKPGTYLDGEENILAEQSITIEGGEYISVLIPVVISTGGNILCTKGIINAVVYAPNGEVVITGHTHLYGAVGGKTVDVINATVTYAAELAGRQDLPGGELSTIAYSFN